ncbi:MAG: FecR domain-containing protein, partial [Bacteroidetes bacterium]|nr:FecR domain-containing protein [Bacteroidota bacterium]
LIYTATGSGAGVLNTITVPRGAQYHVVLADSSEAWLNAASSMTYPASFDGNTREVIIRGEAYFKVAKDAAKPFLVTAGKTTIQVLGTEFDVMAYEDEDAVRSSLVNGSVSILAYGKQDRAQKVVLQAGEQAAFDKSTGLLRVKHVDLDQVLGWRFGEFRCNETGLPAIMRQIARWYDVSVEYRGPVDHIRFSGELSRKHRVQDILDILSDTRKVHFEMKTPATIVVIPGSK